MIKVTIPATRKFQYKFYKNGKEASKEGLFVEAYWLEIVNYKSVEDFRFRFLEENSEKRKYYENLLVDYDVVKGDKRFVHYREDGKMLMDDDVKFMDFSDRRLVSTLTQKPYENKSSNRKKKSSSTGGELLVEYIRLKLKEEVEEKGEQLLKCA